MIADNNEEPSIKLRYVGERFEGTRLPVDVLSDLPAFRDLLVAFAKQNWRSLNAERQRVPKGFDASLSFDLVAVEAGSAVPCLQWDRPRAQALLPDFAGELETIVGRSLTNAVRLFDEAANEAGTIALDPEHIRALNRFGSKLRDDERIEFLGTEGADGKAVYLDNARRKTLITKVRETYETRFEGTGRLAGTSVGDNGAGSVSVDTIEFGKIEIVLGAERVLADFDGNLQSDVQFDLQIELDSNDKYRSITQVHGVGLVDASMAADLARCRERLIEIEHLTPGWDGDEAPAVDAAAFGAATLFLSRRPLLSSHYKIFPTAVGGVLFEFEANGWDLSLEFAVGGTVELFGIEIDGEGELPPQHFDEVGRALIESFDKHVGR